MTETRGTWASRVGRNPWLLAGGALAVAVLVTGVVIALGNAPIAGVGLIFVGVVAASAWFAAAAIVTRR